MKRIIVFFAVLMVIMLCLTACGNNSIVSVENEDITDVNDEISNEDDEIPDEVLDEFLNDMFKEETEKYAQNMMIETIKTVDNDIVVLIDNNNDKYISYDLLVTYYDDEGTEITSVEGYGTASANAKRVPSIVPFRLANIDGFSDYKVEVSIITEVVATKDFRDYIEFTDSKVGEYDDIEVTVKNKSNELVDDVSAACLYYKDGVCVAASRDTIMDLEANGEQKMEFYSSNEDYDDYEILLQDAYTYTNLELDDYGESDE